MNKIRTFVAIELSEAVRERAADLIERLRRSGADVKWVEPRHMHLTLKFLGDVPDAQTPEVCRVVADVAADIPAFAVATHGAGAFPHAGRPRTVWMGVQRGAAELERLHKAVERALARLGFPKESRRFHPHLTLGRVRRGGPATGELGRLIRENESFDGATAKVERIVVFASFLDKSGPTYRALGHSRLAATDGS